MYSLFNTTFDILITFITMLDTDMRKRNNSSMTYNEYMDVYEEPPRKPIHKYLTNLNFVERKRFQWMTSQN